jgi:hypothetical protein
LLAQPAQETICVRRLATFFLLSLVTTINAELAAPAEQDDLGVLGGFCVVRRRYRSVS